MKTKITIAILMVLTLFSIAVATGNIDQTAFNYYCGDMTGSSEWRYKSDETKVFLHPITGTTIQYRVEGRFANSSTVFAASGYHSLSIGHYYSLTNLVHEWYLDYARLGFKSANVPATTSGYWSPDSELNYTIVPLGL